MNWYNGFSPQQRLEALGWYNAQLASGRMERPSECCVCGQTSGTIRGHSENYGKPFGPHIGGFHLCYACHMAIHCRFSGADAWRRYRSLIRSGVRFAGMNNRDFQSMMGFMYRGEKPRRESFDVHARRLILDEIHALGLRSNTSKPSRFVLSPAEMTAEHSSANESSRPDMLF